MPGIFQVKELEAKKKALAAEAEVYRQILKLEARNLGLYALYAKRKFTTVRPSKPLMLLVPALLGLWMRKRRRRLASLPRLAAIATFGWQLYTRFWPIWQSFFGRRTATGRGSQCEPREEQAPAANV